MFSAIGRRMRVSPATVIASLALVLALSGGAYAAGRYVITSTKQISPKVLKSLQGKAGPAGANGAQGAAGPAGAQGAQGPAGPRGETGAAGRDGSAGGAGVRGVTGPTGQTGFTAMLPKEATETGAWSMNGGTPGGESVQVVGSISFPIPLAEALGSFLKVHFIAADGKEIAPGSEEPKWKEQPSTACPGNVKEPKAEAGNLCVYQADGGGFAEVSLEPSGSAFRPEILPAGSNKIGLRSYEGAGVSGATLLAFTVEGVSAAGWGSWAVTAPE
jgi:hypothetical protein